MEGDTQTKMEIVTSQRGGRKFCADGYRCVKIYTYDKLDTMAVCQTAERTVQGSCYQTFPKPFM